MFSLYVDKEPMHLVMIPNLSQVFDSDSKTALHYSFEDREEERDHKTPDLPI